MNKFLIFVIFSALIGCAGPSPAPKLLYLQYIDEVSPEFQSKILLAINQINSKAGFDIVSITPSSNRRPLAVLKMSSSSLFAHAEYLDYRCLIQIDDSNSISNNSSNNYLDLQYILLHEIGHCYGFQHVDDSNNVMYPDFSGSSSLNAGQLTNFVSKMTSFMAEIRNSL